MQVSIQTIMQLPEEYKFILRTIWHPEEGDSYFFLNSLNEPSPVMTFVIGNRIQFAENQNNSYPLFSIHQMMNIIEDYGGYTLYTKLVNKASSINELFCVLWDTIVCILDDGESPEYWALTIPTFERKYSELPILL